MTDESAPRGWQIKGPDDESRTTLPSELDDDALDDPTPPSGTALPHQDPTPEPPQPEPPQPEPPQPEPPQPEPERLHADSIAPMSSPIVTIGDSNGDSNPTQTDATHADAETPVRRAPSKPPSDPPERALGTASEPPAPSARRLVPPPKPKSVTSRPPPDRQVEPEVPKRPYFPAPGLPSAPPAIARAPSLGPLLTNAAVTASPRPSTMPRAPRASQTNEVPPESARPSQLPPPGEPSASAPGPYPSKPAVTSTLLSSRPPPTLPTGALPNQYPWMSSATAKLFTAGEEDSADRPDQPPAENGLTAAQDPGLGRSVEASKPDTAPEKPFVRQAVLPPARQSSPEASESAGLPAAPRAAVLPRATRDPARRSSTPPPKPRIVPPKSPKEHPTASIQAMRIIAIGTEEASLIPKATAARSIERAPNEEVASNPESSAPELETTELGSAPDSTQPSESDIQAIPALPEAALEDFSPLPEFALPDALPEATPEALGHPSADPRAAPEQLGLELVPLQPGETVGAPPQADRVKETAGATDEPPPGEERAPESVELIDAEAQPATRKRPPPPRRISMPSSPDGQATAASSVPSMPAAPAAPAVATLAEPANRQPPPAPSRVPRDPPPRPNPKSTEAKPETSDKSKTRQRRPWWEELFNEDFNRAIARCTDAQIDQEVAFIEESLGVAPGGTLLDLGCGAGHHAVELANRGYGVVGYDLSLYQLALAQEVAQERDQKLNFMQGDMREMAFEEVFDGMYCWNTTFGYFEEEKNILVAQRMFTALKPGGTLLLDVANRDFIALDQPSSVWFEGDSCVCMDDMSVDFFTSRLRVKRSLILDDGRTRECHYSIRLYSLHELGRILHDVGFRVTEASGHPATPGVFLGQTSPRIIVLAQKP